MPDTARINDTNRHLQDVARALAPGLIEIRRDIHAHPELAF